MAVPTRKGFSRTDATNRWLSIILRAAAFLLLFWMVRSLLVAVALGMLLAILLDPLRLRITARWPRLERATPTLLTVGALVLVVLPIGLLAVRLVVSVQGFLEGGLGQITTRMQEVAARHFSGIAKGLSLPVARIQSGAAEAAQRLANSLGDLAGGIAAAVPGQVIDVFVFILALYFFLRDGAAATDWLRRILPFKARETQALFASIRDNVHGALVGELTVSAVQGSLTIITLYLFQVPGALMFGIIATVLSVLPVVGTMPVTVGATLYLFASGRIGAGIGMAIAAVVIGISDNLIRPWVQSAGTGMHPLVTLLAIFGGVHWLGWAGVFLGPVIAAVALWSLDLYAQAHGESPAASTVES